MCVGNRSLWPFDDNQKPVSILVLLDVCREYKKLYDLAKDGDCFNPCFVGCVSGIRESGIDLRDWIEFQSLFCWMCVGNSII